MYLTYSLSSAQLPSLIILAKTIVNDHVIQFWVENLTVKPARQPEDETIVRSEVNTEGDITSYNDKSQ